MNRIVFIMGLVTALAIGCAVGTVARDVTAPQAIAQAQAPVARRNITLTGNKPGFCSCIPTELNRFEVVRHCVCNGLNCLTATNNAGGSTTVSCVPLQ